MPTRPFPSIRAATIALALCLGPVVAHAQTATPPLASRSELRALASSGGDSAADARRRLEQGDYAPGDRVVLEIRGDTTVRDTLVVRAGPTLAHPSLFDLPLRGVLRAELDSVVTQRVALMLREPNVRVESLLRVGVFGPVLRPGYYFVSPDALLSDAIMAAGGPAASAQLDRTELRRGGERVVNRKVVARALQEGATLDRLAVQPGDEIHVGDRARRSLTSVVQAVTIVSSLALLIVNVSRR